MCQACICLPFGAAVPWGVIGFGSSTCLSCCFASMYVEPGEKKSRRLLLRHDWGNTYQIECNAPHTPYTDRVLAANRRA